MDYASLICRHGAIITECCHATDVIAATMPGIGQSEFSGRSTSFGRGRPVTETMDQLRKASTIQLGVFDGMSIPLETHLAKLNNCSDFCGWTSSDRVCHLKASLVGAAATLLWQLLTDCSEERLVQLLRSRFGTSDMIERFRCELRQRRRQVDESIQ